MHTRCIIKRIILKTVSCITCKYWIPPPSVQLVSRYLVSQKDKAHPAPSSKVSGGLGCRSGSWGLLLLLPAQILYLDRIKYQNPLAYS